MGRKIGLIAVAVVLALLGFALAGARKVKPVIDRRYELSELPHALAYLGEGHARGKVIITV